MIIFARKKCKTPIYQKVMQSKFSFFNSLFLIRQGQCLNFLSVPVKYMPIGFQNGATLKCVVKFEHSRNKMLNSVICLKLL